MALFEDSEDAQAQVQSGTLDLRVDGSNGKVMILNESGIAPGDSGSEEVYIRNAGTVDGMLSAALNDVTDHENGRTDSEKEMGDDTGTGELSEYLEVAIEYNGNSTGYHKLADVPQKSYGPWALNGGDRKIVTVKWRLPVTVGNVVQSDKVTADLTLTLTQKTDNPVGNEGTGFPDTAKNGDFNAAFRYADNGGSAEQEIQIQTGSGSPGDTHYQWDESEHSFKLDYDKSNDELTIYIDGTEVTSESGLQEAEDAVSITVASSDASHGGVSVSDVKIDGKLVVPATISATNGQGKKYLEITGQDLSNGLTLEGNYQFTFGASPSKQSPAIYFDFN
jgi:hypothetical protein